MHSEAALDAEQPVDRQSPGGVGLGQTAGAPHPVGRSRGIRSSFSALRHRDFALFWSGALVSNIGTQMQNITVPWVLYKLTDSEAWLGFAAFCYLAPALLVGPYGGMLADRISRHRVLLVTQVLAGLLAFGLWVSWESGHATPALIITLVAMSGIVFGFGQASWHSFVPSLVPRPELLNAVTLNSAQFNAARAIGPMVAGLTLARFGAGAAFLVNAISYLAVVAALLAIRARDHRSPTVAAIPAAGAGEVEAERLETGTDPGGQPSPGTFSDAVRYTRAHEGIMTALVLLFAVMFLASPTIQLLASFAKTEFSVGEGSYGLLTSALGLGAVFAAVMLGAYGDEIRRSRLVGRAVLCFSFVLGAMALAPNFAAGLAVMFVFGMCYLLVASSLNTTIQLLVEDRYRGRVLALFGMSFAAGMPLGALIQGVLASFFGVRVVVGAAGLLLFGFIVLLLRGGKLALFDLAELRPGESS